jgi:hypothetical protein
MPFTGVGRPTNEGSANGVNGADAGAAAAAESALYTGKSWSSGVWKTGDGYPSLAWQTAKAGPEESVLIDDGASGNGEDENAWDGYFSELTPPPYFKVKYRVGDHAVREAVTYTRADMQRMAAADNNGTRYYSAGPGAGRVVKEYVNLETIIAQAGLTFASGDSLTYGIGYSYDGLMANRYYYPEWSSGNATGAQSVAPVIALKSFGASSAVNKNSWDYLAAQADYLYAYMLTFGQTMPIEYTYSDFTYQQTEAIVVYPADGTANRTLKTALTKAISASRDDLDATDVSVDGSNVLSTRGYVSQTTQDTFLAAIAAANSALGDDNLTNGGAMGAITTLETAQKTFDSAKKPGERADGGSLQGLVDIMSAVLSRVIMANSGESVLEKQVWATRESVEAMEQAISEAKAVLQDEDVPQNIVDETVRDLKAVIGDFSVRSGEIEPYARVEAAGELDVYVAGINKSDYRSQEFARINEIANTAKIAFKTARTVVAISEILTDAKRNIDAVRTRIEVLRAAAEDELAASIDLNAYKSGERYQILGILSAAKQALSAAKTAADIERIKSDIREQLALVKTAAQIDGVEVELIQSPSPSVEIEDTALRTAILAAINELGVHYGHSSFYFKKEYTQLTAVINKYTKQVIAANSIDAVNATMAAARAEIAKIRTMAQVNKEKKAAFKKLKTELRSTKAGKRSVAVTWKKVSGAKGYQLLLARDTGFTTGRRIVTINKSTAVKTTVRKLATKKTYHVKVRAYTVIDDKKAYTDWSELRKVKVK